MHPHPIPMGLPQVYNSLKNILGPIQPPLRSCAEPNLFKFDFGATVDSDGVLVLNLIRQTLQNKKVNNSPVSRIQHFCTDRGLIRLSF